MSLHCDCYQVRAEEAAAAAAAASAAAAAAPVVELLGDYSSVSAGEPGLPVPTDPGAGFGDLLPEVGSAVRFADAASWHLHSRLKPEHFHLFSLVLIVHCCGNPLLRSAW